MGTGRGVDHSSGEGGPRGRRASPLTSESRLSCGIQLPHLQTGNTMAHREEKRSSVCGPPPVLRE